MDEKTIHITGWRIIRVIGKGSSGTVYEIEKEDEFGGGIRSALKVISIPESRAEIEAYRDDGYDDESLTKLFRSRVEDITSEFRLMNKLRGSSNIVGYEDHSVVQHENDPGYDVLIRMELLTPLPKYFDRRFGTDAIDERTVRKLGADICRALELCGRFNIIHRDIKPPNIFVSDLGDFKLGDFGIAKTSDHTTRATKTGTYNYMAPEVYRSEPYNATVDIYSLGIVLYWMLNDRRGPFLPLPPEIPTSGQTFEAMERRMHGEPLPAPKNGSEELVRIVLKACAYDPKARYMDPAKMRRDLERALVVPAAEVPAEPTVTAREAGEATVSLFSGKEAPTCDENATVGLFEKKESKNPVPEQKTPEKATVKTAKPATHAEPVPKQEPQKPKKRKKKNVLPVILAAAMLAVAAAIVLVIVLNGRTGAAQGTEAEAVPTLAPTEEPTEAPAEEIAIVAVTQEPTEEPTPEPTEEPTPEPTEEPTRTNPYSSVSVGDTILLGSYEQDNDLSNGKEDIEWIVLAKEENKALIISKYALDCQPYNTSWSGVTWETCSLRAWLNETFLNAAFGLEEQNYITESIVTADRNPSYNTSPGNNTTDKVFLLSITEANKYFHSNIERRCAPTDYAIAQGAYTNNSYSTEGRDTCWWWLRSPANNASTAVIVIFTGAVYEKGKENGYDYICVRPTLWISLGTDSSESEATATPTATATPKANKPTATPTPTPTSTPIPEPTHTPTPTPTPALTPTPQPTSTPKPSLSLKTTCYVW